MRFKSAKTDGFQIFAVAGTNTVSFGIEASAAARKGLLGFAVERAEPKENERYFMPGFKVFRSIIPHPDEKTRPSTHDHPVQSLVWDDFTGKDGRQYDYFFHPLRGTPHNLDRSARAIKISVQTEPLFSKSTHDVFFNRGVASSQAYAEQFNFTVEQELSPIATLFKVAYVGNLGRRLGNSFNLNQPVPGAGGTTARRPFFSALPGLGDITYYVSDGLSAYHALQVSVEKRLSHGLTGLVGYTWAHSIDTVATDFGGGTGTPQDPRCRYCDRGNSAFDLRQRFTVSLTYRLPGYGMRGLPGTLLGGWQLNGVLQSQTGLPFTPMLQNSTTNGTASRPNRIASGNLSSGQSITHWFDQTAFASPAQFVTGMREGISCSGRGARMWMLRCSRISGLWRSCRRNSAPKLSTFSTTRSSVSRMRILATARLARLLRSWEIRGRCRSRCVWCSEVRQRSRIRRPDSIRSRACYRTYSQRD